MFLEQLIMLMLLLLLLLSSSIAPYTTKSFFAVGFPRVFNTLECSELENMKLYVGKIIYFQ